MHIKITDYWDVWGDEIDGYYVNDQSTYGEYEIDEAILDTDQALFSWLQDIGYIKSNAQLGAIRFEHNDDTVEGYESVNNFPLFSLTIDES